MKNLQQIWKRRAGLAGMVIILAISLTSCSKSDNSDLAVAPVSQLSIYYASPDAPSLNVFLNNNLASSSPFAYGVGINYFHYYSGQTTVSFTNPTNQQKVVSNTVALAPNAAYTLFLANSISKPDIIVLTDTLSKPVTGSAGIRFVNVSANAPAVDLAVTGGNVLIANKAYKASSGFVPVLGSRQYNFEIRQNGTSTVLVTLPTLLLNSGALYTVWLHGDATSTNNATKLSADIITSATF